MREISKHNLNADGKIFMERLDLVIGFIGE